MGVNSLLVRSAGEIISSSFFNDFSTALQGQFVGRNSSGVPTSGQELGTASIPWGTGRFSGIIVNGVALDTAQISSPQNRVVSGQERSTSNQAAYLKPTGSANSLTIEAATTNLVLDVNGAAVTVTADLSKTGLSVAPSSNNTTLVNDALAVDQEATRTWGEFGGEQEYITVDAMGSEITALVGKFATFKLVSGANTEYFMAFVESTTKLSKMFRGFFYNSTYAPINRIKFSDDDVITLMKAGFVFVENNATTVDVSYTFPHWGFESPAAPVTGDYWYDMANQLWKRYDGASFESVSRTIVGVVVLDSTNAVAARSWDFYRNWKSDNTFEVERVSNTQARINRQYQKASIDGTVVEYAKTLAVWDITTDLAASADMYNATEQASTLYYLYIKDDGNTVISDISPHWRPDKFGYYHPHNPWRAVGQAQNDGSSNITAAGNFGSASVLDVMKVTGSIGGATTRIDGLWTAQKSGLISKAIVIAGNSGSGTTTFQLNRNSVGPSGSGSATFTFAGTSAAKRTLVTLSSPISVVDGDFGDVDINSSASSLEDITVVLLLS